jgi:hypothetical protein
MRLSHFARRRVGRIVELVGADAAAAVDDARNEFAKTVDAREWKRFCRYLGIPPIHGTTANKNGACQRSRGKVGGKVAEAPKPS